MQAINKNIKKVRFIKKSNSLMLITQQGENHFVNLNLVFFELEIPYTKKNGEKVTKEQILEMKARNKEKYQEAITNN